MKVRPMISAVLLAGASAAACSGPEPSAEAPQRDLLMAIPSGADAGPVSALESGRVPPPPLAPATRNTSPRPSPKTDSFSLAQAVEAPLVAQVRTVAASGTEVPTGLVEVPSARSPEPGGPISAQDIARERETSRGPMILIRGGMGSPHDDCKIHGTASRGGGILVNRLAPPLSGGRSQAFSGPVRIR